MLKPVIITGSRVSFALLIVLASCAQASDTAALERAVLREGAHRAGPGTTLPIVSAQPGEIIVEPTVDAPQLAPGAVLVTDEDIRRVITVDAVGTQLGLTTEPAGLADAFEELDLSVALADDARADYRNFKFTIGSLRLFASGASSADITRADFAVAPDVNVELSLAQRRFHLDYTLDVDADLELRVRGSGFGTFGNESALPGMKRDFVVMVGWVPVVVTVQLMLGWQAELDGQIDTTVAVTIDERFSGAVDHAPGTGWQVQLWDHASASRGEDPTVSAGSDYDLEVRVFIKPKVSVAPLRVAGPYVSLEPNLFIRQDQATGDSHGTKYGLNVTSEVGVAVNLFEILDTRLGARYELYELFNRDVWGVVHRTPHASCKEYTGPVFGSKVCSIDAIEHHYETLRACVKGGGGKSCFTDASRYGTPLCGKPTWGSRTSCNIDAAFTCVCWDGGQACFDAGGDVCP